MREIGVFTIDPWTLLDDSSMKSDLIYFDNLIYFIRGKESLEKLCKALPNGSESFSKRMKELEELEKVGLISEYRPEQFTKDFAHFKDEKIINHSWKKYELAMAFKANKDQSDLKTTFIDFLEKFREVGQLEARTNAIILNKKEDDNFVAIIKSSFHNYAPDEYLRKSNVLSVIIRNFPTVLETMSTERLVEFKSDKEATLKLSRLKNWALDISKTNLTEKEIGQKLEYLLNEYKKQLSLHKLKYNLGVIETFTTVSLEVLENIVKLNFSKAAKVLFDLKNKELQLLEAEESLNGKEVAYLQLIEENGL